MTINPDTLVSKSFIGKELSQGHQAGHSPSVSDALLVPHQSRVSVKLSMLHGTPKDNQLVTDKHVGSYSEQAVTPRICTKQNRTLGQSY